MRSMHMACAGVVALAGLSVSQSLAQGLFSPYASRVVAYEAGEGVPPGFDDPAVALGPPERFTGEGVFPGAVTPFNPAFGADEIVSVGQGGALTLAFEHPVTDDATNPFGVDLLVFANAGYIDSAFPAGVVGGVFADGGLIELSADGVAFFAVPDTQADGPFPTLGYLDLPTPYESSPGSVPSDFTRPVDPSLDPAGLDYATLVASYDGSGGGVGVDIASVGLDEVRFVRITPTAGASPEIDAIADVAPACAADTDGSGTVDLLDFLAFQSRFDAADGRADCDADGDLDTFDFLCYLNLFAAGCP